MATVQNTQREQELANIIWDIKEIIRNLYDDAEVEDVILPFTLLRRLGRTPLRICANSSSKP